MNNILDAVVKLLDPSNDFNKVLAFLGIYLVLLWGAFCVWVFVDARKRYNNTFIAFIFFLLVLILNFPVLIFYFVVRPENPEDNILYLQSDQGVSEGVNVPIVNFVGNNGVEMTFTLRINKHASHASDMKVNVDFVSENKDFKVQEKKTSEKQETTTTKETKKSLAMKLRGAMSNSTLKLSGHASKFKSAFKLKKKEAVSPKEEVKTEAKTETKVEAKAEEVKAEVKEETKEPVVEAKAEEKSEDKKDENKEI